MFCPQITDAFDYDENLIEITKYDVLGSLPNPFLMENAPDEMKTYHFPLCQSVLDTIRKIAL